MRSEDASSGNGFRIKSEHPADKAGRLEIKIHGYLDTENSLELEKSINDEISKDKINELVLDMNDVSYMSSRGVNILNNIKKEAEKERFDFFLQNPNVNVKKTITKLGFSKSFKIVSRRDR